MGYARRKGLLQRAGTALRETARPTRPAPAGASSAKRGTPPGARGANDAWVFVLVVFVLSRLLFLGVGALAVAFVPYTELPDDLFELPGPLGYWAHWDGVWYVQIATFGYDARAPESTAFFPLYPLLLRFGTIGGGPVLFGVLLSLAATLPALAFFYRIAEDLYDVRAARAATLALAFFPTAFFFNAVYTEALFLALALGSIWAARVRRNLLLAGALGALAAATRNPGILLLVPLLFEWARDRERFGWRGLAALGLVPTGLVAYMVFLWSRFGDPLLFAEQQEAWGRRLTNPLLTLEAAVGRAIMGVRSLLDPALLFGGEAEPSFGASNTVGLAVLMIFLFLLGAGLASLPPGFTIYSLVVILQPVLVPVAHLPLLSLPRLVLSAFPVFLILGYLLSRSRTGLVLWLTASICSGVVMTALFTTWRWVA